jgi:2-alkyl-3-oxoalkanoate reductase
MMKTFKVGLVGCGVISAAHLKAWQRVKACTVQGVFDLNRELAEKRSREFNIGKIYDTLEALIAECDIVDICTPPQTHASIAQQAITGGCHLVVEKPLVTDVADWDKMAALLDGSPVTITMIHNLKFARSVQQAKQWVDEGRIGQVIRIQRDFLTSPEADRMLVGNHWSHQLPGGRWFETLPHELYLTHYFVGPLEVADVVAVRTDHAPAGTPADEVVITLKGKECLATVHFSGNCRQNRRAFTVQGTEGIISVDLLADFASLSTYKDRRWKRAIGGFAAAETSRDALRWLPNRVMYGWRQLQGETPHTVIISAVDQYLQGLAETPTPIEEIDYVVRNGDLIGREIDRQQLHAQN